MYLTASLVAEPGRALAGQFPAMARIAEDGGLDAVWLGHNPGVLAPDPLPLLGSLIAVTHRIGLGAAWSADHAEPFHVARVFATLDHLSAGRTAWLFGQRDDPACFRHAPSHGKAAARAREAEFIEVVGQLWDSWEDAAFLLDVAGGRFADPARVHPIHHAGAHFTVRGPLNVPRPPQGNPVLAQSVADGAAANPAAEVLLVSPAQAATMTRRQGQRVLVNLVPEPGHDTESFMADWLVRNACDGFNLLPQDAPALARFVREVVPHLRALGLRPAAYAGATLREHLGLARPSSRFAA